MPVGPPLEGPKGEKLPEPPEGEGTTPEGASTLRWVGIYAGIRVIPCLLVRLSIWQASLERKGDTVPS